MSEGPQVLVAALLCPRWLPCLSPCSPVANSGAFWGSFSLPLEGPSTFGTA